MTTAFTYDAVTNADTLALDASAGTGKTHTLTNLALRLVADGKVELDRLLIVTFTNAATAELKMRLLDTFRHARAVLDGAAGDVDADTRTWLTGAGEPVTAARRDRLDTAIRRFDDASIVTIHGFCQRMLSYVGVSAGMTLDAAVTEDDTDALTELLDDLTQTVIGGRSRNETAFLTGPGQLSRDHIDQLARAVLQVSDLRLVDDQYGPLADVDTAILHRLLDDVFDVWRTAYTDAQQQLDRHTHTLHADVAALLGESYFASKPRQRTYVTKNAGDVADALLRFAAVTRDVPPHTITTKRSVQDDAPYVFFARYAMAHYGFDGTPPNHWLIDLCDRLAAARQHVLTQSRNLIAHAIQRRYAAQRADRNVMTYDDLLRQLYDALHDDSRQELTRQMLRSKYTMALIDEFQDTDAIQWGIFSRLFSRNDPLVVIGDPKQAIYQFRGADVATYLRARDTMGQVFTLDTNWRSDDAHVAAVNVLFGHTGAFDPYGITYTPSRATRPNRLNSPDLDSGLTVRVVVKDDATKPVFLARLLDDMAAQAVTVLHSSTIDTADGPRPLTPRDLAVLVRTNRLARQVRQALTARGIPAAIQRGGSVFHTAEAAQLHQLLAAIIRPHDMGVTRGAAAGDLARIPATTLAALSDGTATPEEAATFERFVAQLVALHDQWQRDGVFAAIMSALGTFAPNLSNERSFINLRHLAELLATAAHQQELGPEGVIGYLAKKRAEVDDRNYRAGDDELRLDAGDDAVTIATVHSAKGLEYPIVFAIDLWDNARDIPTGRVVFTDPDATPHPKPTLDLTLPPPNTEPSLNVRHAERDRAAEQVRLAYVALTRAAHATVVWVPNDAPDVTSPLGVMMAIDGDYTPLGVTFRHVANATNAPIVVHEALAPHDHRYQPEATDTDLFTTREIRRRRFDTPHRHTSFSALTRHNDTHATTVTLAQPAALDRDDTARQAMQPTAELPLATFPRGTRAGNLLHEIFEHLDFATATRDTVQATVEHHARAARLAGVPADTTTTGLLAVIDTPLGASFGDVTLRDIPRDHRADEMPFTLPLANRDTPLVLSRLAPLLADSAHPLLTQLAGRLSNPRFSVPLSGYLTGSIDALLKLPDGRYVVADYKSNYIADNAGGTHQACYAPPVLADVMTEHLYTFQALLYLIATHRYLTVRIPEYTPATHLAGAAYLFLRGMAGPVTPADDGQRYGVATLTIEPELLSHVNRLFTYGADT